MIKFNVPDKNDSMVRTNLSGNTYYIRFLFNAISKYWSFGIYDEEKRPIVSEIKIVPNYYLNAHLQLKDLPKGYFFCKAESANIGRKDFVDGKAEFYFVELKEE